MTPDAKFSLLMVFGNNVYLYFFAVVELQLMTNILVMMKEKTEVSLKKKFITALLLLYYNLMSLLFNR